MNHINLLVFEKRRHYDYLLLTTAMDAVAQLLFPNKATALTSTPESSKANANYETNVKFRKLLPQDQRADYLNTIRKLQTDHVLLAVQFTLHSLRYTANDRHARCFLGAAGGRRERCGCIICSGRPARAAPAYRYEACLPLVDPGFGVVNEAG
jgi:hypothetical protein